ncbi:MAG: DegV family protein [Bacteroidales bacterium]
MSLMQSNILESKYLFFGFISGAQKVISQQNELNRINIFPVADSDTGTNLGNTFYSVIHSLHPEKSCPILINKIADHAINGAKGNSGVIIAQFLHGISCETNHLTNINLNSFANALKNSVKQLYEAVANPVEGTILTVIREWSEFFYEKKESTDGFFKVFEESLEIAKKSLSSTTQKMEMLKKAKLVDAGAKGFVLFLEGIMEFLKTGKIVRTPTSVNTSPLEIIEDIDTFPVYRFCTEGVIMKKHNEISFDEIKKYLLTQGDSVVLAGGGERLHFHVHTNTPDKVINHMIKQNHILVHHKVDDMLTQYNWKHNNTNEYVLVVDSVSDIPQELLDKNQIYIAPFFVEHNGISYLDKRTIKTSAVYDWIQNSKHQISTAQPGTKSLKTIYNMGLNSGKKIISLHTSSHLTSSYQSAQMIQKEIGNEQILAYDSYSITGGLGILAIRIAKALEEGISGELLEQKIEEWRDKVNLFVNFPTLKYARKSGRLSLVKGAIGQLMNVKPILSVNNKGKIEFEDKAFSNKSGAEKLIKQVEKRMGNHKIWGYTITHSGSEYTQMVLDFMMEKTGLPPVYINETSPVIGTYAGPNAICVSFMIE